MNPLDDGDLVSLPSGHGVAETVARLKSALDQKGIQVFADIDHAAGAERAGLAALARAATE